MAFTSRLASKSRQVGFQIYYPDSRMLTSYRYVTAFSDLFGLLLMVAEVAIVI